MSANLIFYINLHIYTERETGINTVSEDTQLTTWRFDKNNCHA